MPKTDNPSAACAFSLLAAARLHNHDAETACLKLYKVDKTYMPLFSSMAGMPYAMSAAFNLLFCGI